MLSTELANLIIARCSSLDAALTHTSSASAIKRHYSVVALAIDQGLVGEVAAIGLYSELPEPDSDDFKRAPLYARFWQRLRLRDHSEIVSSVSDTLDEVAFLVEGYLDLAEDPLFNAWLNFLESKQFGSFQSNVLETYLRPMARLESDIPPDDRLAIAQSILRFVDKLASFISGGSDSQFQYRASVFLGPINAFFGYDSNLESAGFSWARACSESIALWRRFDVDTNFQGWVRDRVNTIEAAWIEALTREGLTLPE
jgi:hypothetical protein